MADLQVASWTVVIPVKRTAIAKSRLASAYPHHRSDLALAFAVDTTAAALAVPSVSGVVIVTDDAEVTRQVTALGAVTLSDSADAGLNPALRHAAATVTDGTGIVALSADLPALRPAELTRALVACTAPRSFVIDSPGAGTTLLAAHPGVDLDPRFGLGSATAHRDSGAVPVELDGIESVRRDVDTAADLADAIRLGVGPRTSAVLAAVDGAEDQKRLA